MGGVQSNYMHGDGHGEDRDDVQRHNPGWSVTLCSGVRQCCDQLTEENFTDNFDGNRPHRASIRPIVGNRGVGAANGFIQSYRKNNGVIVEN